jgi:site-specific DNA recombinase
MRHSIRLLAPNCQLAERAGWRFLALRKRATEVDAKLKRLYDAIENGVTDLSDLMLKNRIAELKAFRDQARADAGAGRGRGRTPGSDHHHPIDQGLCQDGPQADADRERRLPPRLSSRARPARRSRRNRTSHHRLEKRTAAHARRRFKRKNGGFWRAHFCTENKTANSYVIEIAIILRRYSGRRK